MSALQKIADIEAEMAKTQKNKATSGHLGMLKAKLAKLRREVMEGGTKAGGGGGAPSFEVWKKWKNIFVLQNLESNSVIETRFEHN